MNIDRLSEQHGILPEVQDIRRKVLELTGKDIDVSIEDVRFKAASTKIARAVMPAHFITINDEQVSRINHIIAHECGHIIRLFKAAPSQRRVPET